MMIAITGYAFKGHLDDGYSWLKVGVHYVQVVRVANNDQ